MEKKKIAVLKGSLQAAAASLLALLQLITAVWNFFHKDFPRSKEVTLFNSKSSRFSNLLIFIKLSLQ